MAKWCVISKLIFVLALALAQASARDVPNNVKVAAVNPASNAASLDDQKNFFFGGASSHGGVGGGVAIFGLPVVVGSVAGGYGGYAGLGGADGGGVGVGGGGGGGIVP